MGEVQELVVYMLRAIESLGYAARDDMLKRYSNQFRTNCMGFVSLTILLWDHIVTFSDEVEYVWKRTNGPFKYLFLLNRYLIPLGFSVNIFAYLSPALSNVVPGSASAARCAKFIRFEGSLTVIGINIVAIMMFYRVYVLYWGPWYTPGRRYVYILAVILLLEFVVNAWLLTKGGPVAVSPGCEMIFLDVSPAMASSSAWLPLLFDTVAFLLIFRVTFTFEKEVPGNAAVHGRFNLNRRVFEDGLLYYCPILVVTLSLSLMIAFSKPGSQNIMAQWVVFHLLMEDSYWFLCRLELIITVTMMSRISINLKKAYHKKQDIDTELAEMLSPVNAILGHWHARAQVSSVLDITRSGIWNEPDNDLEMETWNRNFDSSTDNGIEYGHGETKDCAMKLVHSSEMTDSR